MNYLPELTKSPADLQALLIYRLCSARKATVATDITAILRLLMNRSKVGTLSNLEKLLYGADEKKLVKYWNAARPGGGGNLVKSSPPQMMKVESVRALLREAQGAGVFDDDSCLGRVLIGLDREELLGRVAKRWNGLKRPKDASAINWAEVWELASVEANKIAREQCEWHRKLIARAIQVRAEEAEIPVISP